MDGKFRYGVQTRKEVSTEEEQSSPFVAKTDMFSDSR